MYLFEYILNVLILKPVQTGTYISFHLKNIHILIIDFRLSSWHDFTFQNFDMKAKLIWSGLFVYKSSSSQPGSPLLV